MFTDSDPLSSKNSKLMEVSFETMERFGCKFKATKVAIHLNPWGKHLTTEIPCSPTDQN